MYSYQSYTDSKQVLIDYSMLHHAYARKYLLQLTQKHINYTNYYSTHH